MPELPKISGVELVRALERLGFTKVSQRGSHIKMKHSDGRTTIVPNHRELKPGTLKKGILNPLDISVDMLNEAIKRK